MIPTFRELPVPTWLSLATPRLGVLPLPSMLAESVYYPASGLDGDPIKWLATNFQTFVYADYGLDRETVVDALPSFRGYEVLGLRDVTASELFPKGWPSTPPLAELPDQRPWDGFMRPPFAIWAILQRTFGFGPDHGPTRFSLLFVGGDGVATFDALYCQNGVAPAAVALIQPGHAFGGNWTNFTDPRGPLARAVMGNPAGAPTLLLEGGMGDAACYERPCWPYFSAPIWTRRRNVQGTLRLWRNAP